MRKGFQKLLSIRILVIDKYEDLNSNTKCDPIHDHDVFSQDALRAISREKKKTAERFIMLAAKLIAPVIDSSLSSGYDWIVESIKASPQSEVASELEISKGIQFLKQKDFAKVRIMSLGIM